MSESFVQKLKNLFKKVFGLIKERSKPNSFTINRR